MPRKPRQDFTRCTFLPYRHRENVPRGALMYDVSSYADHPFCAFSPMWVPGGIPVPGWPGQTSDSVEGVWQGLKVIRGKIAPRLFRGKGVKRGGKKPEGHRYGDQVIGYAEARRKIYLPAYEWVLANRIDPALIQTFLERARAGQQQFFHDLGDNGDLNNLEEAIAHSSLLVRYLNRLLTEGQGG